MISEPAMAEIARVGAASDAVCLPGRRDVVARHPDRDVALGERQRTTSLASAGNSTGPKHTAEMTSISGTKMPSSSDRMPVEAPIITSIVIEPAKEEHARTTIRQKPSRRPSTAASRIASIGEIFEARFDCGTSSEQRDDQADGRRDRPCPTTTRATRVRRA